MSCISIPNINNRIGWVYVNPVTHLKPGNPWLMVVLKFQSLVMRFLSFLKENAYHSCPKNENIIHVIHPRFKQAHCEEIRRQQWSTLPRSLKPLKKPSLLWPINYVQLIYLFMFKCMFHVLAVSFSWNLLL